MNYLEDLERIIEEYYYENINENIPEKCYIAYEGRIIERDLLKKIGIPSINLEIFSCPKMGELLINDLEGRGNYRKHVRFNENIHCSKIEVELFDEWLHKTSL